MSKIDKNQTDSNNFFEDKVVSTKKTVTHLVTVFSLRTYFFAVSCIAFATN